ncbi:hypothetical protein NA56DRAFT_560998 [Hyaloscypha hepaticicola]|uniref:DASH complex subunit Hsk3 like-domain-containing protein n=2 Tax=Hyaloscypha hepaticicola/Rhizoscyphus ericae species complex TaxID=186449 RepID=A0A2J6QNW7_9HELO|nr:hypothetical protein NA56DRAFT_560998 [Hyaloscypha hepaticicola]
MTSRIPNPSAPRLSTAPSSIKPRQLLMEVIQSHLHAQLASLSANLADLENLLRMTSVQAESVRGLGAWHGGLFMAASKVLGEETIAATAARERLQAQGQQRGNGSES